MQVRSCAFYPYGGALTKDAVLVNDTGPIYGRDAIEKMYADLFQKCISATTLVSPISISLTLLVRLAMRCGGTGNGM
jgi:hypothetical protein